MSTEGSSKRKKSSKKEETKNTEKKEAEKVEVSQETTEKSGPVVGTTEWMGYTLRFISGGKGEVVYDSDDAAKMDPPRKLDLENYLKLHRVSYRFAPLDKKENDAH